MPLGNHTASGKRFFQRAPGAAIDRRNVETMIVSEATAKEERLLVLSLLPDPDLPGQPHPVDPLLSANLHSLASGHPKSLHIPRVLFCFADGPESCVAGILSAKRSTCTPFGSGFWPCVCFSNGGFHRTCICVRSHLFVRGYLRRAAGSRRWVICDEPILRVPKLA